MGGGKGQVTLQSQTKTTEFKTQQEVKNGQQLTTGLLTGEKKEQEKPKTPLEAEIVRLEQLGDTLTEEEKKQLSEVAPQGPEFKRLAKEDLAAKKKSERKAYKKAEKEHATWKKEKEKTWEDRKRSTASAVMERAATKSLSTLNQDGPVEATPDAMDQALLKNTEGTDVPLARRRVGNHRVMRFTRQNVRAKMAVERYMDPTSVPCMRMNEYMRTKKKEERPLTESEMGERRLDIYEQDAERLKAGLSALPGIPHDMVVRRGAGTNALAGMLGDTKLSEKEIKDRLIGMEGDGNQFLMDKGFCSTSVSAKAGYAASGVEFIILVRKGTKAIDMSNDGSPASEQELVINAGTQFRVVKAFFNDGQGSGREACLDNRKNQQQKSWKVYLETVPQDGSGTEA